LIETQRAKPARRGADMNHQPYSQQLASERSTSMKVHVESQDFSNRGQRTNAGAFLAVIGLLLGALAGAKGGVIGSVIGAALGAFIGFMIAWLTGRLIRLGFVGLPRLLIGKSGGAKPAADQDINPIE
jgi:hypothetical protein